MSHYNLGIAYIEMDLIDEAVEEFKLAGTSEELNYNALCLLALCYQKKKAYKDAIEYYIKATEKLGLPDGQKIDLFYNLALSYLELKDEDSATKYFKKVYRLNPRYKELENYLSELHITQEVLEKETTDVRSGLRSKISFI